ncbi:hypothetical protein V7128_01810 [Neobacillus vireti]|uniref:hypothetical protein n=1 Tax=Neobacillus vireti TaxID=220686 RepID=UPI002FFF7289
MSKEQLEIFDEEENLTLGIKLSDKNNDRVEVYTFNPYYGHGMTITLEDVIKLRDKLDELIKLINKE